MNSKMQSPIRPVVQVIGDVRHPNFRDAIELLDVDAQIVNAANQSPELILVAQSRPGMIAGRIVDALRRTAPLAGIVSLVGSWCEGETRTGKPWPGVERLHWYEFPTWWRRQLARRVAGRCPDWSRPGDHRFRISQTSEPSEPGGPSLRLGLIALRTPHRATAAALSDTLRRAGYATAWQPQGHPTSAVRGALAGIWDGGQLSDHEADDLLAFCKRLANDGAPVMAMLDFPRRDCADRATQIGVAAVLGKPWLSVDLLAMLQKIVEPSKRARAA